MGSFTACTRSISMRRGTYMIITGIEIGMVMTDACRSYGELRREVQITLLLAVTM